MLRKGRQRKRLAEGGYGGCERRGSKTGGEGEEERGSRAAVDKNQTMPPESLHPSERRVQTTGLERDRNGL